MKLVGRRLEMHFSDEKVVVIEQRFDNQHNLEQEKGKCSKLFDVIDFDGETILKEITPIAKPYGQDLNTVIKSSQYWITQEDCKKLDQNNDDL